MEFKTMTHNNKEYVFLLDAAKTRNGFKHVCTLKIDGYTVQNATAYYLNRTWECYRFQSVMLQSIRQEIDYVISNITATFKDEHGYKRLTAERYATLQCLIDCDAKIIELRAVYEIVRNNYHEYKLNW